MYTETTVGPHSPEQTMAPKPGYLALKESQDKAIAEYQAFFAQQGISPEEARNQLLELNAQEEQPAAA